MPPSSPSDLSPSVPSRPPLVARLAEWLRHFWPAPLGIDGKERLRFVGGAVIGVLLTAWLSRWWAQGNGTGPWMVASLGASAVLVFGMPSSPLAQPWPVIGGNTISALVGVAVYQLVPGEALAGSIATSTVCKLGFSMAASSLAGSWSLVFRRLEIVPRTDFSHT